MSKKDQKISVFLLNSCQRQLQENIIDFVKSSNKSVNKNIGEIDFSQKPHYENSKKSIFDSKNMPLKEFFAIQNNGKKTLILVKGLEILLNIIQKDKKKEFLDSLLIDFFPDNTKQIMLFIYQDQLFSVQDLNQLTQNCSSIFNFLDQKNDQLLLKFTNFNECGIQQNETLEVLTHQNEIRIIAYIPKESKKEEKDPDQLIGSTFKLGLGQDEKKNKNSLILPHFKDKQIEEIKRKTEQEEEYQLGMDDEELYELDEYEEYSEDQLNKKNNQFQTNVQKLQNTDLYFFNSFQYLHSRRKLLQNFRCEKKCNCLTNQKGFQKAFKSLSP